MKLKTISTILAGITAGAVTLWYTTPVKNIKVKQTTKKVRTIKRTEESSDHLFI